MNKSSRDYHRQLTTNSFNQDFIYYKHAKQPSRSPRFKAQAKVSKQVENNHSIIQNMKNTLDSLFDPLSKAASNSYNRSVMEFPTYDLNKKHQLPKNSKSLYQQINPTSTLNNKLQLLTLKLRQIAEKPHFTQGKEQELKKQKSKASIPRASIQRSTNTSYTQNLAGITKLQNQRRNLLKLQQLDSDDRGSFIQEYSKFPKQNKSKNNQYLHNYSQQLQRSKSKSSSTFYGKKITDLNSSNSQSSSIKRQPKQLKNDKSVSTFQYRPELGNQKQTLQRPRGKTVANIINTPVDLFETQSAKIKINSYLQNKSSSRKSLTRNLAEAFTQIQTINPEMPFVLGILSPHRAKITSIIINSDGKRFLTASNDYQVKQSTLDGKYSTLRKHEGRVHVMRMIEDRLYTGGNDCKVKFQKGQFSMQSPVLEIHCHQKQYLNIGTSSTVELFNIVKNVASNKVSLRTKFYQLCQKVNKDTYYADNHHLSIIDWRVPYPFIKIFSSDQFVQKWISDPYSIDFYQFRDKKLFLKKDSKQTKQHQISFSHDIKEYAWKKDKIYFLNDFSVQVFQNKRNQLLKKSSYSLHPQFCNPSTLQIKNNLFIYGNLDGKIVVSSLQ